MNNLEAKKLLLTCPGDTIQENIDYIGMSQAELALRMGRSKEKLNELIKGKAPVTQETAMKLEYVLGIPAHLFIELENKYQAQLLEIEQMEFLQHCIEWTKKFPLLKMKKLAIVPDTKEKSKIADSLLRYFRVPTPKQWAEVYKDVPLSVDINAKVDSEREAISVWLRYGEVQANNIEVNTFDKKAFKDNLYKAKKICFEHRPNWQEELQDFCAKYGVFLVYTPSFSKAPVYGAARWIKNLSYPLLQITENRKDTGSLWFTFFHECGHLILHGKKDIFLEGSVNIAQDTHKEAQADNFANEVLATTSRIGLGAR